MRRSHGKAEVDSNSRAEEPLPTPLPLEDPLQKEAGGHEETPHTNDTVSDMGAEAGSSSGIAVAMPNYIKDSLCTSPSELCIGCMIRCTVPQTKSLLIPQWSCQPEFRKKNAEFKKAESIV